MYQIHRQDVIEWAKEYQGPKAMAMLCDPPYHLTSITKRFSKTDSKPPKGGVYKRTSAGFMGSVWDSVDEKGMGIAFDPATWAALASHLYPGAFILAFGGSRGYHRMATAMEESGLIIHPAMGWLTLSGFPKSTRIDTQIDRAAGNIRPDKLNGGHIGMGKAAGDGDNENELQNRIPHVVDKGSFSNGTPVAQMAQNWQGHRYGLQALKPAFEFIAVAQVPYSGKPVDSIVATGAGALNIDAGRIGTRADAPQKMGSKTTSTVYGNIDTDGGKLYSEGRWPANFVLTHHVSCNGECHPDCPVRLFDEQAGVRTSGTLDFSKHKDKGEHNIFNGLGSDRDGIFGGDSGPASRMFYQADFAYEVAEQLANADPVRYEPKVSSSEREAGLDELETRTRHRVNAGGLKNEPRFAPTQVKNNHPCLKPISLTKYLCQLLSPPAAYAPRRILIPFAGSGSEMVGAILSGGFEEIIGIEAEANYVKIAEARCSWWSQWPGWGQTDVDAILAAKEDARQLSLFKDIAA